MKVPMSWLKEYVNIDCTTKEYIDKITLSGSKVECVELMGDIKNVVVGQIKEIEKHPDADKLVITKIDIGQEELLQIVTGAKNISINDYVPVALDGSVLFGGIKIKKGKLRGVISNGMLCSIQELGFDISDFPEACEDGIYIFPDEQSKNIGKDIKKVLDIFDEIVEFEITSNRPDCFSILGIARETAATLNTNFKFPKIQLNSSNNDNNIDINEIISVDIQNSNFCSRYVARAIKNVKIEPSPRWMRKRLRAAGIKPINNIVDITNYVMLEIGQPMHAFDIDTIISKKIVIRNAKDKEKIITLDEVERTLDESMLVISDDENAVAIAGIMGGENSKITEQTNTILFESASFNGSNIRLTSKKLGLRTDSSSKFEKGLDPNLAIIAINRAIQLVEMIGAGEVIDNIIDCYPVKRETWKLNYSPNFINKLLGTNISDDMIADIFEKIEIKVDRNNYIAEIPTFRPDLECEADLAEEVARFYGYDKIVPTLAIGTPTAGKKTYSQNIISLIKNIMVANGLYEAMTFTFESPKVFDKLNVDENSFLRNAITISNPLGEDFSIMRTFSVNSILNALSINYNRRNEEVGLFEVGKVYIPKVLPLNELPNEYLKLTIGMYGKIDFYDIKGIIENLFEILGMNENVEYSPIKNISYMHKGRTAEVLIDNESFGYFGEIHPEIAERYNIGTRAYIAVIDIETIVKNANLVNIYKPLPKFPSISRDISIVVKENIIVKDIETIIKNKSGKLLEEIKLFDVYKGTQIEEGYKSVAYSIKFRALDRTLIDEEVNSIMNKIIKTLKSELDANLRDK